MYDCDKPNPDPQQIISTVTYLPNLMAGRRAVPLPDGFAIGLVVSLASLALVRRRGASKPQLIATI